MKDLFPHVLITGGSGYLGRHLTYYLSRQGFPVIANYFRHPVFDSRIRFFPLDLTLQESVVGMLQAYPIDVIIHTAYERDDRDGIITVGTQNVMELARLKGANLIHLSTDLVFSGQNGFYSEEDVAEPVMEYGKHKLEAERIVQSYDQAAIIRTSLIYCMNHIPPHFRFAYQRLKEGQAVKFFVDEIRNPVFVDDLNAFIAWLIWNFQSGIYHFAGPSSYSRYELGWLMAQRFVPESEKLIMTASLSESADLRAADCSLNSEKARQLSGLHPRSVNDILKSHCQCQFSRQRKRYDYPKITHL
ncbi:MAG: SDR family oxidoreductase [Candidatus Delongbacteria bacterium]|nr:SDR family oxidoreductase [Candidatus Delongbacteria bacterium]